MTWLLEWDMTSAGGSEIYKGDWGAAFIRLQNLINEDMEVFERNGEDVSLQSCSITNWDHVKTS